MPVFTFKTSGRPCIISTLLLALEVTSKDDVGVCFDMFAVPIPISPAHGKSPGADRAK